ncbi:methyltransferase [Corynebacterium urealyticum]|nr:putative transferase [Corynebacterium urealyticum DSM 7111]QQB08128.1 methyltransferase [Corynebacterium urealyticum]QQE50306.1 methyltransferase [Corynebacterium urealyticum]
MQSQFPNHDREKKAIPTVTTQPSSMQLTSQPTREALSSLLAASRERGLSTTLLEDVLGEAGLRSLNLANPAGALRSVRSYSRGHSNRDTCAAELVELFVLREPATRARWQELIGTDLTRRAIDARLIASLPGSADELQLRVDIRPYSFPHLFGGADGDAPSLGGEFLLASDPDAGLWPQEPTPDDHVPGLGNAPRSLLRAIPPADNPWLPSPRRILDLGCGGGALSLALQLAYPEAHVVGTDISGRALDFAAINGTQLAQAQGQLSTGVAAPESGIEWREGSWFEPVAGERFDLIVSNPPFVVQPPEVGHVYRDSGLGLDRATELVVSRAPEHLAPGGTAHILCSWAVSAEDSVASKMGRWLPAEGVRAYGLVREYVDPETYVTTWLSDEGIDPRSPEGRRKAGQWLHYLADNGVSHIALGFAHLRAIDGSTEVTVEQLPDTMVPGSPLGAEVAEWFIRSQWLADVSAEDVLAERFAVRPGVATELVRQADAEAGQSFRELSLRLARTDGPAWTHEIDAAVESILAGLNPEGLALEDVLGLYAAVTGPSEDESHVDYEEVLMERMLGIIVDLVRHGIVLPSSLVDWAER